MVEVKYKLKKLKKMMPKQFSADHWKSKSRGIEIRHEMKRFTRAFRDNFATLIISSLGLLVALSWNNLWNAWMTNLRIEDTVPYKFYIALGTTIFAVILTYLFSKLKTNGT
jgi:hypothetical protein